MVFPVTVKVLAAEAQMDRSGGDYSRVFTKICMFAVGVVCLGLWM
jgi:hypothetical protein